MRITELFDRGEFVVTAEVGPPKGIHVEHLVEEAKEYLSGITAVNVTDNQSSVMRLGSLATCKALKDAYFQNTVPPDVSFQIQPLPAAPP